MESIDGDHDPDPVADDPLGELAGHLNAVNSRVVRHTVALLADEGWRQGGRRTPAAFLCWKLGLSAERAKVIVDMAERIDEFSVLCSLFERGELSVEQVAEAVKAPSWADADIADFCRIANPAKIRRAVRSDMFEGDPDEQAPERPAARDRVRFGVGRDGRWRISGTLGVDVGRRVEAALNERKDAMFTDGHDDATWADAFVDCFDRSLGAVESVSRRDHYRTWIHLDVTDGAATTTDGWRIPKAIRDHLLCDGIVQPVWERDGVPFSVGASQRIVPDRTRRIIEKRDRGCRVPGCAGRYVEIHHIVHWSDGGPTDTWNLISLCRWHHKLHHQGVLGISGNADEFGGVIFIDSRGSPIIERCKPVEPTVPTPTTEVRYRPPLVGRFDWNWIGLGWIHPNAIEKRREQLAAHDAAIDRRHRAA